VRTSRCATRRGAAAVAVVLLLVLINMIVVGLVLGGARDHELTTRRVETVQAFYAAEAGVNMAIREIMLGADEDGDGAIGSVSDDGDAATDPPFGAASVFVTVTPGAEGATLSSRGRAGRAERRLEAVLTSVP
jgi:type II secretory pathway component PulK